MKKCVVVAVATFMVGSMFAEGENLRFRTSVSNLTSTSEAVMSVRDVIMDNINHATRVLPISFIKNMSDVEKAEVDSAFAPLDGYFYNKSLPQCYTNYVNSRFDPARFPVYNSLAFKTGMCIYSEMKPNMEETIAMFGELSNSGWRNIECFRYWQNWMKKAYFQELKIWFRKNGKSVVEKNGVNPLAPYMDGLMAALNAPRMEGLNQCLETIGIDKKVDLSVLPSEDKIYEMRESVLIANIDLTKNGKAAFDLMVCLGVDGYNEMVRKYNDGD